MIKNKLDVVIVSWAKDDMLKQVTTTGIETLIESEPFLDLNIYVVESNRCCNYDNYEMVKTIYPKVQYGYNRYLNIGRRAGSSEFVCLCNNDLIYKKGWATKIINEMIIDPCILSASPFDTLGRRKGKKKVNSGIHYGYNTEIELAGWCIFQKREIYDIIGDLDENFEFWYCDNDYAMTLKKNNIRHCLVSNSIVNHHNNKIGISARTIWDEKMQRKNTDDQLFKFNKKWM